LRSVAQNKKLLKSLKMAEKMVDKQKLELEKSDA